MKNLVMALYQFYLMIKWIVLANIKPGKYVTVHLCGRRTYPGKRIVKILYTNNPLLGMAIGNNLVVLDRTLKEDPYLSRLHDVVLMHELGHIAHDFNGYVHRVAERYWNRYVIKSNIFKGVYLAIRLQFKINKRRIHQEILADNYAVEMTEDSETLINFLKGVKKQYPKNKREYKLRIRAIKALGIQKEFKREESEVTFTPLPGLNFTINN